MTAEPPAAGDAPLADPAEVRRAMEYYAEKGWTDGLPVVPVTETYLREFLATADRDPGEVLLGMPHLNRAITVRLAAINAALAGCLPEYFPVVIAAWEALLKDGMVTAAIWQSTTGTAPFLVVNGPVRNAIGINCKGNVFGSGFRANATIARAIRLGTINALGLRPHVLDQATQGTPAKYMCCIGENEEDSPWPALHVDYGFAPADSTVTATVIRSVLHIEARHTTAPEQLAADFADSLCRTGALVRPNAAGYVVLNPEHARLLDSAGWSKQDLSQAIYEFGSRTYGDLTRAGKEAIATGTKWRLPAGHPDAMPHEPLAPDEPTRLITDPAAIKIVVAGAPNAGVSSVVETFGRVEGPPAIVKIARKREKTGTGGPQDLKDALQKLRDVLTGDGYDLNWALHAQNKVAVQVIAGPDACADCLVPEPLMAAILSDALAATPYTLESLELPAGATHD